MIGGVVGPGSELDGEGGGEEKGGVDTVPSGCRSDLLSRVSVAVLKLTEDHLVCLLPLPLSNNQPSSTLCWGRRKDRAIVEAAGRSD